MNTIFQARRILTMNPSRPEATHVAVRDGRILGAGSLDELRGWGPYVLDDRFAAKVLMPGLVEGHSHVSEGAFWRHTYVGYFDRTDPNGRVWSGVKSIDAVVERLRDAAAGRADQAAPLSGWSLDPIYFGSARMSRQDLDRVSTDFPIGVMHASGHILNVNSRALELAGLLRAGVDHPGIPLGADGLPTGEMKGPEPMTLVGAHVGYDREQQAADERALRDFSRLCVRAGVTTATDLANLLPQAAVDMMSRVTGSDDFPTRIVSLLRMQAMTGVALVERALALRAQSSDRLRLGAEVRE